MPLPFASNVCFLYYRKLSLSFLSDSLEAVIFFGVFSPHDLRTDTESQDSHITTSRTLLAVLSATGANEHKIHPDCDSLPISLKEFSLLHLIAMTRHLRILRSLCQLGIIAENSCFDSDDPPLVRSLLDTKKRRPNGRLFLIFSFPRFCEQNHRFFQRSPRSNHAQPCRRLPQPAPGKPPTA